MAPQKNQMFRPAKEDGEFVPLQRVFHQILGRGPPLKMKKMQKRCGSGQSVLDTV